MNVLGTVSPGCLVHSDETSFSCNSEKGNDRICYSFKEINTMTELLHLPGLDKRVASFKKSKTLPPRSCNNLGECFPNF